MFGKKQQATPQVNLGSNPHYVISQKEMGQLGGAWTIKPNGDFHIIERMEGEKGKRVFLATEVATGDTVKLPVKNIVEACLKVPAYVGNLVAKDADGNIAFDGLAGATLTLSSDADWNIKVVA